jgi:hypothetical protein
MSQSKHSIPIFGAVLLLASMPVLSDQYGPSGQSSRSDRSNQSQSSQSSQGSYNDQSGQASLSAEEVIQNWKETPQKAAHAMIKKYGQPQEVTEERLVWHDNGPWKRTEVINEEIDHKFPMPHKDALLQVIDYQVPADKFDELAAYDGSVIVERTRGELAARCDKEEANFLAINLAHEIATGKRSVAEARKLFGEKIVATVKGKSDSYTKDLNFRPQTVAAGDPDNTTLDKATVDQVTKLMKEKEEKMARAEGSNETMTR